MKRRAILLASASTMLGACATRRSIADGSEVSPSLGLLAFKIEANTGGTLDYSDLAYVAAPTPGSAGVPQRSPGGAFSIVQGDVHFITPLEPGEYTWSRFTTASLVPLRFSLWNSKFAVKAGTITYIGHLGAYVTGRRLRMTVTDREADMRTLLGEKFPVYLRTWPFEKALTHPRA